MGPKIASRTKKFRMKSSDLAAKIHPHAQRKVVPAWIKSKKKSIDLGSIGVTHIVDYGISGYGSGPWVVDGQNRNKLMVECGYGDVLVDVCLHEDIKDDAGAAKLFLDLNSRSNVNPYDKFLVELVAEDDRALAISGILKSFGLKHARSPNIKTVSCIAALKKLYDMDGGDIVLNKALQIITSSWPQKTDSFDGKIVEGIGLVVHRYNGEIDYDVLTKKLAKYPGGPLNLIGSALGLKNVRNAVVPKCIAEVIMSLYNSGRRVTKLSENFKENYQPQVAVTM